MMSAIAGVNQALWDIKGKYHGVRRVYELLGVERCEISVQIYAGHPRRSVRKKLGGMPYSCKDEMDCERSKWALSPECTTCR